MAHFYASIEGSRGVATRTGTKQSGMTGHIRGWEIGARVELRHIDGRDVVQVYRTAGSSGWNSDELVAEFSNAEASA